MDNLADAVFFVDCEGSVTQWNRSAEELIGRPAEEVIGRPCTQEALLHIDVDGSCDGPDACPTEIVLDTGHGSEADVYLRHHEGHLVPVHVRAVPLHDSHGQLAGAVEIMSDNTARIAARAKIDMLRKNSLLDPVTETASRKHLEIRLQAKLEETRRYGWRFGMVAAGIDNFPVIRDAHSRETIDHLVRMAGKTFANTLRTYDVMGRWAEDNFLAVVTIRNDNDLKIIAERVRALVEKSYVTVGSRMLGVTLSIGVTTGLETDTVESVVERARRSLHQSLDAGGNKVH